ncbi:hypothetical protein V6N13_092006 [Hibiscus sabdariffa]
MLRKQFVRYSSKVDAERTIERLLGFVLYGSKISVSFAKVVTKTQQGRKTGMSQNLKGIQTNQEACSTDKKPSYREIVKRNLEEYGSEASSSHIADTAEPSNREEKSSSDKVYKRVIGHIEEETLWKLGRCLIGTMATVCSSSMVKERLNKWGLGEITVKSLGGRDFFIEINDPELYKLLEDLHWSYLKEVFINVEPWSESYKLRERVTWVQVSGIPLQCWNNITFNRIAEMWGYLLAMGENANQIRDCYKVNLLLSVKQEEKIDECLQIEVGNELFMVRVLELGFQVAGGSEGIKVHCRDSLEVTEDSSSEVAGKSPGAKVQTCVQMKMKRQRSGITVISLTMGRWKRMYRWKILGGRRISRFCSTGIYVGSKWRPE